MSTKTNVAANHDAQTGGPTRMRPELLAPAGDRDCLRAAVENGADAVYFGLNHGFNARARAANFELADLPEIMRGLRQRGVRGYVTLNTLVFSGELPDMEQTVRAVTAAGVDAVLVQDLGIVQMIREISPLLAIHASTQMTLTSADSIREVQAMGVERVVVARELSLRELRKIRQQTTMPLEVFVHGALCVAYSGQCLTSESFGGRSANRGQCAQACRLPYDLVCDGRDVDLGDVQYLLSPQDLAAYAMIPELIEMGICAFKIEGRLKTPEYVANITSHYRRAIDAAMAARPVEFTRDEVREMELSFSRGFSPGWLQGCDHKMLVPGLSSTKRGVLLGEVTAVQRNQVAVRLSAPLAAGDGVVFDGDRQHHDEQGGRVYDVRMAGRAVQQPVSTGVVQLTFQNGVLDFSRIWIGQKIWKTDDPRMTARLRRTFRGADPIRRTPLKLVVEAAVGRPLRIVGQAESGARCDVTGTGNLALATKHPLTIDVLRKQLGRLGGTVYQLHELEARMEGTPMVPHSVLGEARHEMVRQLDASLAEAHHRPLYPMAQIGPIGRIGPMGEIGPVTQTPRLHVLCRTLAQLDVTLQQGVNSLYADFQDIREYAAAVPMAHGKGATIFLATPRIQKPDERGIFHVMLRHGADGILVRNLAGMAFFRERGVPFVADFSLNATNPLSVEYLRDHGATRVTASYDLNREQLLEMAAAVSCEMLEVVIHQHMPMFHMEHCVFCAVLSPGTNKTNCGRPCDRHDVHLRDRIGMEHTLKADVGCRNTLFNAVPQSAAEVVPTLMEHGLRDFRVELLDQGVDEIPVILMLYRDLLCDKITGNEVWRRLRASNRVGVTRGTLEERRNPLAIL